MGKQILCRYAKGAADDAGIESLKLYLPVKDGYVNFNIVHSVSERINCDTWRLSVAYHCDDDLICSKPLTRKGAEWEMALKILERPDFIGGFAHGDEVFQKAILHIDGESREIESVSNLVAFDTLVFEVWSLGYDPLDSTTKALSHYKKITVNQHEIRVEQKVEWMNDYSLGSSYMAMMPPFKDVTDSYYTNINTEPKPISVNVSISETGSFDTLYLCGDSGFTFGMKIEKYVGTKEHTFLISDNGGVPYNKMYFPLDHSGSVKKGDIFDTCTVYSIKN